MKCWVKVENGVIVQKQPNEADGFIEADDSVVCGFVLQEDGSFAHPGISDEQRNLENLIAAKAALDASDVTAARCFKAGVKFPQAWSDYCTALRVLIQDEGEGDLPARPAYPAGT